MYLAVRYVILFVQIRCVLNGSIPENHLSILRFGNDSLYPCPYPRIVYPAPFPGEECEFMDIPERALHTRSGYFQIKMSVTLHEAQSRKENLVCLRTLVYPGPVVLCGNDDHHMCCLSMLVLSCVHHLQPYRVKYSGNLLEQSIFCNTVLQYNSIKKGSAFCDPQKSNLTV